MPDIWESVNVPSDFMDELRVRELIEKRLREMCPLGLVCQNTAACPYRKDGDEPCDYPFIGTEYSPMVKHFSLAEIEGDK